MPHYYDWRHMRWVERTPGLRLRPRRARHTLLEALVEEMREGDSETQLYAGLLARKLLVGDEEMMRAFGKEVAEMLGIVAEHQRQRQAIERNAQ